MYNVIFILFYYFYFLSIVKRLALKRISVIEILLYCTVLLTQPVKSANNPGEKPSHLGGLSGGVYKNVVPLSLLS